MPSVAKLPSGWWRAQVRRNGRDVSESFPRSDDALCWPRLAELSADRNETPVRSRTGWLPKFRGVVKQHVAQMSGVGKLPRRPAIARPEPVRSGRTYL